MGRVPGSPDLAEDLLVGQDAPGRPHQDGEKVVFDGAESYFPSSDRDAPEVEIDEKVADRHRPSGRPRVRLRKAAKRNSNPGQKLACDEGLGDVVVGSCVESGDLVGLALLRRDHDDRGVASFANSQSHVDPVEIGQAQVQENDVRLAPQGHGNSVGTIRREQALVSPLCQHPLQERARVGFVVDDENCGGYRHGAGLETVRCAGTPRMGSVKLTTAPPPSRFAIQISPSCAATTARQRVKPSPTPPSPRFAFWPRRSLSKILSSSPATTPGPRSPTSTRMAPSATRAPISTGDRSPA